MLKNTVRRSLMDKNNNSYINNDHYKQSHNADSYHNNYVIDDRYYNDHHSDYCNDTTTSIILVSFLASTLSYLQLRNGLKRFILDFF